VEAHPNGRLLQSIPGIGPQLAATIAAEIGDIARFQTPADLRSYSGLVPSVRQSGERRYTGPLVKRGNRYLRWALVMSAQHFIGSRQTQSLSLMRRYRYQVHKHGPNPAKVAVARRLLNIIFAMLRDGSSFDPARYVIEMA
jgi:transposase